MTWYCTTTFVSRLHRFTSQKKGGQGCQVFLQTTWIEKHEVFEVLTIFLGEDSFWRFDWLEWGWSFLKSGLIFFFGSWVSGENLKMRAGKTSYPNPQQGSNPPKSSRKAWLMLIVKQWLCQVPFHHCGLRISFQNLLADPCKEKVVFWW